MLYYEYRSLVRSDEIWGGESKLKIIASSYLHLHLPFYMQMQRHECQKDGDEIIQKNLRTYSKTFGIEECQIIQQYREKTFHGRWSINKSQRCLTSNKWTEQCQTSALCGNCWHSSYKLEFIHTKEICGSRGITMVSYLMVHFRLFSFFSSSFHLLLPF